MKKIACNSLSYTLFYSDCYAFTLLHFLEGNHFWLLLTYEGCGVNEEHHMHLGFCPMNNY